MKFHVTFDDPTWSWYLEDDTKQIIARMPALGMTPKSAVIAQINRIKSFAHGATIVDQTPEVAPKHNQPAYILPDPYDRG